MMQDGVLGSKARNCKDATSGSSCTLPFPLHTLGCLSHILWLITTAKQSTHWAIPHWVRLHGIKEGCGGGLDAGLGAGAFVGLVFCSSVCTPFPICRVSILLMMTWAHRPHSRTRAKKESVQLTNRALNSRSLPFICCAYSNANGTLAGCNP